MSILTSRHNEIRMGGSFTCPRCGQTRTSRLGSCRCDIEAMEKKRKKDNWDNTPSEIRKRAVSAYEKELRESLSESNKEELRTASRYVMTVLSGIFGKENLERKCESVGDMKTMHWLEKPRELSAGQDWIRKRREIEDKLLELLYMGYGGPITEEEWETLDSDNVWTIDRFGNAISGANYGSMLTFRTKEDAERFANHEDNLELVKQYRTPITRDIIEGRLKIEDFISRNS